MTEPAQIAAFIFASRIGGVLFRKRGKILAGARPLQNFFGLGARLPGVELRMLGNVGIDFGVGRFGIGYQSLLRIG